MAKHEFTKGLHDLGDGCFAYLQPDGGWGWSNAGLVVSQGQSLLVDTLFDVPLTQEMVAVMRAKVPEAARIDKVINTHANPDHFFGNQVVKDSEIIATRKTGEDIAAMNPAPLRGIRKNWQNMGVAGEFIYQTMGRIFDFESVTEVVAPTTLFEDTLDIPVGDKTVKLVDLGPAHTTSDIIAYVPEDRIVYTGDLLFNHGHPLIWSGTYANWIKACDYILGLDVEVVVPGHGPLTDKSAVQQFKAYFEYVYAESRSRFDAGMTFQEAARDIALDAFRDWGEPERIVSNVYSAYKEFDPSLQEQNVFALLGAWVKAEHEK